MRVTLSRETQTVLEHVARSADVRLRPAYAGRGMTVGCLAVVGSTSEVIRFVLGLAEEVAGAVPDVGEELGTLVDAMRESRTVIDQLGHDSVYYWPEVEPEVTP